MKYLLILFIASVFITDSFAQLRSSSELPPLIRELYGIRYSKDKKSISMEFVGIADSTNKYFEISNKYNLYLSYFFITYCTDNVGSFKGYMADSAKCATAFYTSLDNAALFKKCLNLLVSVYDKEKRITYKEYTPPPKPVISIHQLMVTAAKFFYADDTDGDTSISYHVCWH